MSRFGRPPLFSSIEAVISGFIIDSAKAVTIIFDAATEYRGAWDHVERITSNNLKFVSPPIGFYIKATKGLHVKRFTFKLSPIFL